MPTHAQMPRQAHAQIPEYVHTYIPEQAHMQIPEQVIPRSQNRLLPRSQSRPFLLFCLEWSPVASDPPEHPESCRVTSSTTVPRNLDLEPASPSVFLLLPVANIELMCSITLWRIIVLSKVQSKACTFHFLRVHCNFAMDISQVEKFQAHFYWLPFSGRRKESEITIKYLLQDTSGLDV